jgi:ankyrin repeat protein
MYNCRGIEFIKLLYKDLDSGKIDINHARDVFGNAPVVSAILYSKYKEQELLKLLKTLIDLGASPFIPYIAVSETIANFFVDFCPANDIFVVKGTNFINMARSGFKILCKKNTSLDSILDAITSHKLDINSFFSCAFEPMLHTAIRQEVELDLIRRLLFEHKANVNAFDYYYRTPLTLAFIKGDQALVELLFKAGSDISLIAIEEQKLWMLLKIHLSLPLNSINKIYPSFDKAFIEEAMTSGDDLNLVVDSRGMPFMIALLSCRDYAEHRIGEIIICTLKNGYLLHKKPVFAVLKYVIERGYLEIAKILLSNDADVSCISFQHIVYLNKVKCDLAQKLQDVIYNSKVDKVSSIEEKLNLMLDEISDLKAKVRNIECDNLKLVSQVHDLQSGVKNMPENPKEQSFLIDSFDVTEYIIQNNDVESGKDANDLQRIDDSIWGPIEVSEYYEVQESGASN